MKRDLTRIDKKEKKVKCIYLIYCLKRANALLAGLGGLSKKYTDV
jgi:hypothetical protein